MRKNVNIIAAKDRLVAFLMEHVVFIVAILAVLFLAKPIFRHIRSIVDAFFDMFKIGDGQEEREKVAKEIQKVLDDDNGLYLMANSQVPTGKRIVSDARNIYRDLGLESAFGIHNFFEDDEHIAHVLVQYGAAVVLLASAYEQLYFRSLKSDLEKWLDNKYLHTERIQTLLSYI